MTNTMRRLPVAICTDGVFPQFVGGAQRHTRLLVEHLARHEDLDITVLHQHPEKVFAATPGIREITVPTYRSGVQYLFDCYGYSRNMLAALRTLPSETIVYGQCLAVWSGVKGLRHRFIFNPHGLEPFQSIGWEATLKLTPMRKAHDWLFWNARHIVSLGGRLTDIINRRKHPAAAVHVLPNAVALPPEPADKAFVPPLRLLFIGRHVFQKGITHLLQAIRLLDERGLGDSVHLDLVGSGPLRDQLMREFPLPNVKFHGGVPDERMAELLRRADLFVFPTLFEGMPTAVMEGMAQGTPIAVSDTGATLDLLTPDNGFLLRKQDPAHVAETIERFLAMPIEDKRRMGRAAYETIRDRFTWENVAADHRKLFHSLAGATGIDAS
jgi:glycosyltransferase involved in cell wall biosynthesis